jgi:c-di-GMP-related signal transduction protein
MAKATDLCHRCADLFLTGLFSLLEKFLDQTMEEAIAEISLAGEIKGALLGEDEAFKSILDLVVLYERGIWNKALEIAWADYNLDEVEAMPYYLEALELADMAWK